MFIPQIFNDDRLSFVKLKYRQKVPFEKCWQEKKYSFYEASKWSSNSNIGLQGSEFFVILDIDQEIGKEVLEILPQTARTITGSGGTHAYFFTENAHNFQIDNDKGRVFDLQSEGKQAVMPGSIHPNGNYYKLATTTNIAYVDFDFLIKCLEKYGVKKTQKKESLKRTKTTTQSLKKLKFACNEYPFKISDVLRDLGFDAPSGEGLTDTPFGISQSKQCLHYDDLNGVWFDFNKETSNNSTKYTYAGTLRRLLYLLHKKKKLPAKYSSFVSSEVKK
jgi:hypothetical protein